MTTVRIATLDDLESIIRINQVIDYGNPSQHPTSSFPTSNIILRLDRRIHNSRYPQMTFVHGL